MSETLYRCTLCDQKLAEDGRFGHLKFTDGDGHGPKGEVPENAEDYFVSADSPLDEDGDEDSGNQTVSDEDSDDSGNGQSSGSTADPEGNEDGGKPQSENGTETEGIAARIKRVLMTDISDL